jgi:hypothetical protein
VMSELLARDEVSTYYLIKLSFLHVMNLYVFVVSEIIGISHIKLTISVSPEPAWYDNALIKMFLS